MPADRAELERLKYERMWEVAGYRAHSPGHALVKPAIAGMGCKAGDTLIDWGCGTGAAAVAFAGLGLVVTGFDIAKNCLSPGVTIPLVVGLLWDPPKELHVADYSFSSDVLEHIPPEHVGASLDAIAARTRKAAFVQVFTAPDGWGARLSPPEILHLSVMPPTWWEAELGKRFQTVVAQHRSNPRDPRAAFLCFEPKTISPAPAKRLSALLLGNAATLSEDTAKALDLFTPDAVAATNNAGSKWPGRLDYWVTLHPVRTPDWDGMALALKARLAAGLNRPETWACVEGMKQLKWPGIDRITPDWGGASGLFGVKVLREEGFERIVLAGVPMTSEAAHFYNTKRPWQQADRYRPAWLERRIGIAPFVRSLSGWTKEIFGEPTREWLEEAG